MESREILKKYLKAFVLNIAIHATLIGCAIWYAVRSYDIDGKSNSYIARYMGGRFLALLGLVVFSICLLSELRNIILVLLDLRHMEFHERKITIRSSYEEGFSFHRYYVLHTKLIGSNKYMSFVFGLFLPSRYYLDTRLTQNKKNRIYRLSQKYSVCVTCSKYAHIIISIN
jgi:hypothetical protein